MSSFSQKIIHWQRENGRHDLPWQAGRDAYRIWVSEIMLQQTQVSTVIGYYNRFMARFPDVTALAAAPIDEVMAHWAGLGYYARARHLHQAALQIVEQHQGQFPRELETIASLKGVGRSTAAAIAAFAFGKRAAILDGNVKRVMARHFGVGGDIKARATLDQLWTVAEAHLPRAGIEAYTQGLMDLGATLCQRSKPRCDQCPVQRSCVAFNEQRLDELPGRGPQRVAVRRERQFLVLRHADHILLERRPAKGIWGGLWSLPECDMSEDPVEQARTRFALRARHLGQLPVIEHAFTHYTLGMYPHCLGVSRLPKEAIEQHQWHSLHQLDSIALPAPIKKLLSRAFA